MPGHKEDLKNLIYHIYYIAIGTCMKLIGTCNENFQVVIGRQVGKGNLGTFPVSVVLFN